MRFQAPRGTEDILPLEVGKWQRLEKIFRDVAGRYGYQEIRTPAFEDTDLFLRTAGETSDVVSKEMYTFTDKGGRSITLKPEGTAPAMRAVIEHALCPPGTITRLMYFTSCFRYSRPQSGRLREHHQVGLELIGSSSPAADAEIIEVIYRYFEACGLTGLTVLVNSIGRAECRGAYCAAILDHMAPYLAGQPDEVQAKARKNPMRLLDTKDPEVHAALVGVPPITDYLEEESRANFARLQQLLTAAGIPFVVRPDIVRGLDYYTETVFEVVPDGAASSICGGGRYDNLIKEIGGSATPSVGVGSGIERTLLALAEAGVEFAPSGPDTFIVQACSEAYEPSLALARKLRSEGLVALVDIDGRSMKSQLRQADKSGAKWALILGEEELRKGTVQCKDLTVGTQVEISADEVISKVRMNS